MLEGIGMTEDDETAYLRLIDGATQPRRELADALGWSPGKADRVLDRLVAHGLARPDGDRPSQYTAIAPSVAVAALSERTINEARHAEQLVPTLMERYWAGKQDRAPVDFLEIFSGTPKVVQQRAYQLQAAAKKTVRALDRPPYPGNIHEINPMEPQLIRQGVSYRVVYDQTVLDTPERWPDLEVSLQSGEDCRVLAGLPTRLTLLDDWAATMPILTPAGEYSATLVIYESPLLELLSRTFEFYWQRAMPLRRASIGKGYAGVPADGHADAEEAGAEHDPRLVTLLAAGLTDAAIARTLGISRSTMQRRIRGLMQSLGVRTRFQAGLLVGRMEGSGKK